MKKLSKNCYQLGPIEDPGELYELALQKASVHVSISGNVLKPAAFVVNWQFWRVMQLIKRRRIHKVLNIKNYHDAIK